MDRITGARRALAISAGVLALALGWAYAGGSYDGEGVELPREVVAAASTFSAYMDRTAALRGAAFSSGDTVAAGLRSGAAYEPGQFEEGMIGFGAIAALQDGRFVGGVQDAVQGGDRRGLADRLAADPNLVLQFDGADGAALRIEAALSARGEALARAGADVKKAAYDVQHQAWSTRTVANPAERLSEVKSLSTAALSPPEGEDARLFRAVMDMPAPSAGGAPPVPPPLVVRAMALAASAVLGAATGSDLEHLRPLLSATPSAQCLKMSKLNLYQCMAVAGPQYEDVFCLGQHAMIDTGQCVTAAAGLVQPNRSAQAAPSPAPPATVRPYLVPVARRTLVATGQ